MAADDPDGNEYFVSPYLNVNTPSSWTEFNLSSTHVYAMGAPPASNYILWYQTHGPSSSANSVGYKLAAYRGQTFVEGWYYRQGPGWFQQLNADNAPLTGVPEPATLTLLGLGIVGMATRRKLRKVR